MSQTPSGDGATQSCTCPRTYATTESYRLFFEHSSAPVAVIEKNTVISLVNKAFLDLAGYSREEIEGKMSFLQLLPRSEKTRLAAYHRNRRIQGGNAPNCYETRVVGKDGAETLVRLCVDVIQETSQSVVHIEDLTQRRRRETRSRRQTRSLAALHEIAALATAGKPIEDICSLAFEAASELTASQGAALFTQKRNSKKSELKVSRNIPRDLLQALSMMMERVKDDWLSSEAGAECRRHDLTGPKPDGVPSKPAWSVLSFPLFPGIGSSAVLCFVLPAEAGLPREDHDFLTAISNHLAAALRLQNLSRQQEEKISHLQILFNLGKAFASTLKLPELLEEVHSQLRRLMDVTSFYVALYDESREEVSFEFEIDRGERKPHRTRKKGNGVTEYILRIGKPLLMNGDVMAECKKLGLEPGGDPAKSWVGVPLLTEGKPIGVIAVQDYDRENVYTADHLELLSTVASQAAAAVQNARLYHGLETRVKELHLVNEISTRISAGLTLKETLETVTDELGKIITSDSIRIYRFNEDRSLLIPETIRYNTEAYPYPYEEVVRRMTAKVGRGFVGWTADHGEASIVENGPDDPRTVNIPGTPRRDESLMAAPLVIDGAVEGVLVLAKLGADQFTNSDLNVLKTIANQAAVAIKNAELFEELSHAYDELKQTQNRLLQTERKAAIIETVVAINHEINNPLAAIVGSAQLLLLKPAELSEDIRRRVETILAESFRIKKVTEKLSGITETISKQYPGGMRMLDIEKSTKGR